MRRWFVSITLLKLGFLAGFAAAAAAMRAWVPSRGDASSDELALVTIFDGLELDSRSTAFRGGRILTWFGGLALDLRNATLAPGAALEVRAMFGGVTIAVPDGWRVDHEGTSFIGGTSIEVPDPLDPQAPVLLLRTTAVVGGVAVGTKPVGQRS